MVRLTGANLGWGREKKRGKYVIIWSIIVLVLFVGNCSSSEPLRGNSGELTTISLASDAYGGITIYAQAQETLNGSKNDSDHRSHDERYKVAEFDWDRVQTPMLLGLSILACTLAKLVFHFHERLSSFCPESCLLILIGVIVGLILYGVKVRDLHIEGSYLFFYLIPLIILDAGYFIPSRSFFDNIGTVLVYGIIGTVLCTFLLGLILWGIAQTPAVSVRMGILECLGFAALLSAVDPMSVLTVFDEIPVTECLYIIVFGESLLNNGIAVILYQMFEKLSYIGTNNLVKEDIVSAVGSLFVVSCCGTLTGIIFGFLASLLTRVSDHVPVIQPLVVLIVGYIAYIFAEMFHFSGILACAFCSLTMRKYVKMNMSRKSHTATKYFLKLLASIADTMIFIYLGVTTVINSHQWDWGFCLLTLIFCLIIRAAVVFCLTVCVNTKRLPQLNAIDQFIMSYGGLRGAIAFTLVIDLKADIFSAHRMYFTTTILVIMFTNFVMGSTIKPLVEILKVTRAKKVQQSLNHQIHRRMIEHLMGGIEDITGHHGHHQLRQKFEFIDRRYLQRILVRKHLGHSGWTAVHSYDKLNQREVQEYESAKSNYGSLIHHFHSENGTMRNFSFMRWLSSVSNGCMPNGYPNMSVHKFDTSDQIQIDMQAMEAMNTRKMRDDSKVHHIIEDSMFVPRKRFLGHRRHILPPEGDTRQQQMHHKARLHLRHLMSHHHRHDNGSFSNGSFTGKPKKNVSFAEVAQLEKVCDLCTPLLSRRRPSVDFNELDGDMGSTHAESGASDIESDEIGGIIFTADSSDDFDLPPHIPVEPVAVELFLPWKRNTGRAPLESSIKHSMPDDQHPLTGEAPSWVNNTEYTSPGSPPVTPESKHHENNSGKVNWRSSTSSSMNPDANPNANLIILDTPDHKPLNRDVPAEDRDENHERTVQQQETPSADVLPWKLEIDEPAIVDNAAMHMAPLRDTVVLAESCDQVLSPALSNSFSSEKVHDAPDAGIQSEEPRVEVHRPCLPWRQNSVDFSEFMSTRTNGSEKPHLPWRQNSQDSSDSRSSASVHNQKPEKPSGFPLPWRENRQVSPPLKEKMALMRTESGTALLPWRDNSNVEVKLDQCAPRPPPMSEPEKEESHVPPPPWRQQPPEPDLSIRSPSASCELDMYSLRPQHSSHSFRISEAESKHSEPIHVHHMIEIATPRGPHIDYDSESVCSLELDSEHVELDERICRWIETCEPESLEPDDLDLDISVANRNHSDQASCGGTFTVSVDIENNVNQICESVL